jgi:1,4-alpha-glucan branching enzyme
VSVAGAFSQWEAGRVPLERVADSGVWQGFVPGVREGDLYKFAVLGSDGVLRLKADPMGRSFEAPPGTASRVAHSRYRWADGDWMRARGGRDLAHEAMLIYEVHLGSWAQGQPAERRDYRRLARSLLDHVQRYGFNFIELLPVAEHPFGGSWGYQVSGYFAPTARFGLPDDFRAFVDLCHQHEVGVIVDWVPAHFVSDEDFLARFDGEPLYEYADPRLGRHPHWGTSVFDFQAPQVRSFLLSNALYWMREFHVDGLRVDAVSSMLYRDYGRAEGQWIPNAAGGPENDEAVSLLRLVNQAVREDHPGCFTVAEESSLWPKVTAPVGEGGLGFAFKWNLGWMHDTLQWFQAPVEARGAAHHRLCLPMSYDGSERFINPLSHDEVVHLKRSLLGKMPGDEGQRFANLRMLLAYQYLRPGKVLVFMGTELAPEDEWDHGRGPAFDGAEAPLRRGLGRFLEDLGRLYAARRALWAADPEEAGFEWIDGSDRSNQVISFLRRDPASGEELVVILHGGDRPQRDYRIGVPAAGAYRLLLDTDARGYGGGGLLAERRWTSRAIPWHGRACSLSLDLPPLAVVVLVAETPRERPRLWDLASRVGILEDYVDLEGSRVPTSDDTREALLAGLGIAAASEAEAEAAAMLLERDLPPVPRVELCPEDGTAGLLRLPVPESARGTWRWEVQLERDDHGIQRASGAVPVPDLGPVQELELPSLPGVGSHRIELRVGWDGGGFEAVQQRLVAPEACVTVPEVLARGGDRASRHRAVGLCLHLYSLNSRRNWGIGDVGDLRVLARWAGARGLDFIGLNPLHATGTGPDDVSPYRPISRCFENPIYLDVEAVPELADCAEARREIELRSSQLAELRAARRVDYPRVWQLKRAVLSLLHRRFRALDPSHPRRRAYAAFDAEQGGTLRDFGVFMARREGQQERGATVEWRRWPAPWRDPRSPQVAAFAEQQAELVDFHAWLQFELDRQLSELQELCAEAGLRIGIYKDLAVGSAPDGFDAWAFPHLHAHGPSLGAPPDPLGPLGQDWALAPLNPRALEGGGLRFFGRMLRSALRGAGALRVDHALGLVRQFWIPPGRPPVDGAYLRFPAAALLALLAVESRRSGALIVGEDLGTVPPGMSAALAARGILSTRVYLFHRREDGGFDDPERVSGRALLTFVSHDTPTLQGWWSGRDLELRLEHGLGAGEALERGAAARRAVARTRLEELLRSQGCLIGDAAPAGPRLVAAVHRLLRRSPAPLVGLWLDDLCGEVEPLNIPGLGPDQHPSWKRRLSRPLEELLDDPEVDRMLGASPPSQVAGG